MVPGRMDVMVQRFRDHLPAIFDRCGIRCVGSWTVSAGPRLPMFVYITAHEDLAAREEQWARFYADPEWPTIRAQTQGDAEAVERFDLFFAYSKVWTSQAAGAPNERLASAHDMLLINLAVGLGQQTSEYLENIYLPALEAVGARILLSADLLTGPALPRLLLLIAWPDADRRQKGWLRIENEGVVHEAIALHRRRFGRPLLGESEGHALEPTPFAQPAV